MTDQCTLFLGDLSILCNENTLRDEFRMRDMAPTAIKIMRIDGRPRGFGFVSFPTKDLAVKAMTEMNGQTVHGRKLRIKFAAYRLPDMTPITTSALIHSVHVKFTTHLMTHFDGTLPSQLPLPVSPHFPGKFQRHQLTLLPALIPLHPTQRSYCRRSSYRTYPVSSVSPFSTLTPSSHASNLHTGSASAAAPSSPSNR